MFHINTPTIRCFMLLVGMCICCATAVAEQGKSTPTNPLDISDPLSTDVLTDDAWMDQLEVLDEVKYGDEGFNIREFEKQQQMEQSWNNLRKDLKQNYQNIKGEYGRYVEPLKSTTPPTYQSPSTGTSSASGTNAGANANQVPILYKIAFWIVDLFKEYPITMFFLLIMLVLYLLMKLLRFLLRSSHKSHRRRR